jgi:hypothetical protein
MFDEIQVKILSDFLFAEIEAAKAAIKMVPLGYREGATICKVRHDMYLKGLLDKPAFPPKMYGLTLEEYHYQLVDLQGKLGNA